MTQTCIKGAAAIMSSKTQTQEHHLTVLEGQVPCKACRSCPKVNSLMAKSAPIADKDGERSALGSQLGLIAEQSSPLQEDIDGAAGLPYFLQPLAYGRSHACHAGEERLPAVWLSSRSRCLARHHKGLEYASTCQWGCSPDACPLQPGQRSLALFV